MKRKLQSAITMLMAMMLLVSFNSWGQGFENFDNLDLSGTSYQDGEFEGQDGSMWTFWQCRGDVEIDGTAIMIGRNRTPQSNVYSGTIAGGVGVISFDYMQAFSTNVNLNVLVNDVVVGNVTSDGEQNVVKNSGEFVVNQPGDVVIKFINENNGDGQVVVDNVAWTAFDGAMPPSVSNIIQDPATDITSEMSVSVSADITAGDAPVEMVELHWGTESGMLDNDINMSLEIGNTYVVDANIPAQLNGTTVYYVIYVEDEDGESSTSAEHSYLVRDPAVTDLPYEEDFETDLGELYVVNIAGSIQWQRNTFGGNGFAHISGFQSGELQDSWLVIPGIDMDVFENVVLAFDSEYRYHTDVTEDNFFELLYSTDYPGMGDPSESTWTSLSFDWPTDDAWGWIPSGDIAIPENDGILYLAFRYHYLTNHPTWRVDNILITGEEAEDEDPDDLELVHFFFFGGNLPNNTPLETIEPTFDMVGGTHISFHSALEGYPFDPDHPNWRKASMERRNAATDLNYHPEGNDNIPYEDSGIRGMQVKQPFTGDGGENTLFLHLPTTGYEHIVLRFAAMDEGDDDDLMAAENLLIDYAIEEGGDWLTEGLAETTLPLLHEEFTLFTVDFSGIEAVNNNADFVLRIRFDVPNPELDDGDRVAFNNISVHGLEMTEEPVVITIFPWLEGFEDDSETREHWTQIQELGEANWTFAAGSSGGLINTAFEGELNARFVSQSGTNSPITKLVSPVLDLTELTTPMLAFYYGQEVWFGDQNETKVYYRTDAEADWIELAHYTENVNSWTLETIMLPEPSATYQIAFEGINNYGRANVIDNVEVKEAPEMFTVTFEVEDEEGNPIENAEITLAGMTNDAGDYVFEAPVGEHEYLVTAPGYENATGTIEVIDEDITETVVLMEEEEIDAIIVIYTDGDIPTTYDTAVNIDSRAEEPGLLTVEIPEGKVITGVDIEYSMTAHGGAWIGEQRSFLLCATNDATEGAVYSGVGNMAGTLDYERTGLNIANGLSGEVEFELHAFRTWGGSGSDTQYNYVNNETWKLTVYYGEASFVEFSVTDGVDPLENVSIAIDEIGAIYTDADGVAGIYLVDGEYNALASLEGYHDQEFSFTVAGEDAVVDVILTAIDAFAVTFTVEDAEANPIVGAAINISETDDRGFNMAARRMDAGDRQGVAPLNLELITDENGQATFDAESGMYNYTVTKEGFLAFAGDFEVIDMEIDIPVTLMPDYADVTFYVDMTDAVAEGGVEFDPEIHSVYLTGSFTGWATPGDVGTYELFAQPGEEQTILYENFNAGILPEGWLNLDENGDGNAWFFVPENHDPIDGDFAIASASWDPNLGPLTPDNWLITPQITDVQADYMLSFYVKAQDPDWPNEKYDVLVSTSGNDPDDFSTIHSETLSDGEWKEVVLNLEAFANEDIYIAFRHWESSDWFRIVLDAIHVYGPATASMDYAVTVENISPGHHEYKYFLVEDQPTWDLGETQGEPNRLLIVEDDDMDMFDIWGFIPEYYTVEFDVQDQDGDPITDAIITLGDQTNPAGDYLFEYVQEGSYEYLVVAFGYEEESGEIIVDQDKTVTIEMTEEELFIVQAPYFQGFDDIELPDGWEIEDLLPGGEIWEIQEVEDNPRFTFGENSGFEGGFAVIDSDLAGSGNSQLTALITPFIDISELDNPRLEFEHMYRHIFGSSGAVMISQDGGEWEEVVTYTSNQGTSSGWSGPFPIESVVEMLDIFNLIDPGTELIQIAFVYQGAWSWYWLVDNFEVKEAPEMFTVTFEVEDDSGLEVDNAVITLNGVANAAGDYVFENVEEGDYDYTVTAEGYQLLEGSLTVDGDVTESVILFELFDISFHVADEDDMPLENAEVVVKLGDEVLGTLNTDNEGNTPEIGLIVGNYTYNASLIGYALLEDVEFEVTEDAVINITMTEAAPTFSVNPETYDFGLVALNSQSHPQEFVISNIGSGVLTIDAVALTGDDANVFVLTDVNEYPAELGTGEEIVVQVVFVPEDEGVRSAQLDINFNDGEADEFHVELTGEGFERPAGSTCENPYVITELPLIDFEGDTEPMGDDYSRTWVNPNSWYLNGNDMVFEFTLDEPALLSGSMTSPQTWIGLFILEDCPNPDNPAEVLQLATSTGSSVSFDDLYLPAGTYFAIVSSWPAPQTIEFTLNLSATEPPDEFTVTFHVKEDSADEAPIEGANIAISGFGTITTGADGMASIDLPNDTYTANITASGYVAQEMTFTVDGQDKDIEVHMMDNILDPFNLEVVTEGLDEGQALFSWNNTEAEDFFEGFEGAFPPAGWHKMNPDGGTGWMQLDVGTTPLPGWNVGEAIAAPDGGDFMAYASWQQGGSSYNDQWLVTPEMTAAEGFELSFYLRYFPDSYDDNVDIRISTTVQDDVAAFDVIVDELFFTTGSSENWELYTYSITDFVDAGETFYVAFREHVTDNFNLGSAIMLDNVHYGAAKSRTIPAPLALDEVTLEREFHRNWDYVHEPVTRGEKAFLGFNVYLNDNLVATEISDTEYLFIDLPGGEHTAGVQSVYTTGSSEIKTINFEIDVQPVFHQVTFEVDITQAVLEGQLMGFDPDTYHIFMTGSMLGWTEPGAAETVMTMISSDPWIYQMTLELEAGTYQYKYFSDFLGDGWDGGEYHGGSDRVVVVDGDMTVEDEFTVSDAPEYTVTFEVSDTDGNVINNAVITFNGIENAAGDYVFEGVNPGTYAYQVVADGYKSYSGEVAVTNDHVTVEVELEAEVSTGEPVDATLSIFPNPAREMLYIEHGSEITGVRVVDILGQVVYAGSAETRSYELNVSGFDPGVYFIQVTTVDGVITQRVQVSR